MPRLVKYVKLVAWLVLVSHSGCIIINDTKYLLSLNVFLKDRFAGSSCDILLNVHRKASQSVI